MKMMNKVCALVLSVALCAGMAAPAFAYDGEPVEEVEQPVLTAATEEEEAVTVTDEETGALTPEGNLTLVDDYHTSYSDGSGQQFITLVSKSGNTVTVFSLTHVRSSGFITYEFPYESVATQTSSSSTNDEVVLSPSSLAASC